MIKKYAGRYKVTGRYENQQEEFDQTDQHLVHGHQYHQDDHAHGQILWTNKQVRQLQRHGHTIASSIDDNSIDRSE